MSEVDAVPTTALHPTVEAASQILAGVLVGELDVDTALSVSEAILILGDVFPPPPPLHYPETGTDAYQGITTALGHLARAVEETPTAAEALRAGRAAQVLRDLLARPAADEGDPLLQTLAAPERR